MSREAFNKTIPIEEQVNFASAQYGNDFDFPGLCYSGASFDPSRSSTTLRPKMNNQLLDMFISVDTSKYPIVVSSVEC